MKKSLFIIAATALVVGCASNDVKNDINFEDIPIGFGNSYIGNITKATYGTNAGEMTASNNSGNSTGTLCTNGNTMEVWAWKTNTKGTTKVFDNTVVTYNPTTASTNNQTSTNWVYSPIKFWDRTASYIFYAVAPDGIFTMDEDDADADARLLEADGILPVQVLMNNAGDAKIKLATDGDGVTGTKSTAKDYLVAAKVPCAAGSATQGNDQNDKDVNFSFNHILSKLDVNVLTTTTFNHTGSDYPQIWLTDLKINLAGMCPTWNQKIAGAINPNATDGDKWSGTPYAATDHICFDKDGTKVTSDYCLSTTPYTTASYFIAPTATGTTNPLVAAATCDVKILAEYDIIYDGNNDPTSKEHCISELLVVDNLKSFVQNYYYKLNITIAPKEILFDVQTVNNWTDGTDGTIIVQ